MSDWVHDLLLRLANHSALRSNLMSASEIEIQLLITNLLQSSLQEERYAQHNKITKVT